MQNARDVSNEIAQRTGVKHESPQALLMRDGTVTWHASHWSIQAEALQEALAG
ncbi:MAG: monothiol bacilliredoxin BrxC family protein [Acidobacteriota bacterium]